MAEGRAEAERRERAKGGPKLAGPMESETDRRPLLRLVLQFALGVALVLVVVVRVGLADLGEALTQIALWGPPAAYAVFAGVLLTLAVRWRTYLRVVTPDSPRLKAALSLVLGGLFLGELTPGRVGDVLRSYLSRTRGYCAFTEALPLQVVERIADIGMLGVFIVVGSVLLISDNPFVPAVAIGLVIVAAFLLGFCVLVRTPALVRRLLKLLARPLLRRLARAADEAEALGDHIVDRFFASLWRLKQQPVVLGEALGLTALLWGFHVVRISLLAAALGVRLDPAVFILVVPLTYTLAVIPLTLGGLGVMEAGGATLYVLAGVDPAVALAIPLLDRVLFAAFYVPLGYVLSAREVGHLIERLVGRRAPQQL